MPFAQMTIGTGIIAGIFLVIMSSVLYRLSYTKPQRSAAIWMILMGLGLFSFSMTLYALEMKWLSF